MECVKRNLNIVCTIDESYVQHCGVMLCSLFWNNRQSKFNIYLLTDGLSDFSAKRLSNLCARFGHHFIVKQVDASLLQNARISDHVSLASYYRVFIPRLLPEELDIALFLDSDIIVRGSISEFYSQSLENFTHAAVRSPFAEREVERLEMPDGSRYFNAGVLLLNLDLWRAENLSERILNYINSYPEKLVWWDQDALNAVLQGRWYPCPAKWNATEGFFHNFPATELGVGQPEYDEAARNPRIVHFSGGHKPWMPGLDHPFKAEYYKYLRLTGWKDAYSSNRLKSIERVKRLIKTCLGTKS